MDIADVDTAEQRVHESFKHLTTGTGTDHLADRCVADQSGVISEAACLQLSDAFNRNNTASAEFVWFQRHAQDAWWDRPKSPVDPDEGTARDLYDLESPTTIQIDSEVGAAELIASQAAIAVSPNDPALVRVQSPPSPESLQAQVESDVNALFLVLGAVSLLIGAIGIANVTLVSVLERVGEIGLRRALGASRRHIAYQFLLESTGIGFFGGVIGASAGVLVVVAVSASNDWIPVLDTRVPLGAPLLGALVGLLAGLYPAWRASRLEPVESLRASGA